VLHGKKLLTTLRDRLSGYATVLGLRQDWMMFAPNPMRENTFIDAEITYRSGRKSIWTFPQMPELGYAERYAKERYRKFANERLWVKEASFLWPDAARYIARLNREPSDPVRSGKSNVLRSGPIAGFSEGLRTKAGDGEMQLGFSFSFRMIRCAKDWRIYVRRPLRGTGRSSPTQAAAR
jgi:hypothetical protein